MDYIPDQIDLIERAMIGEETAYRRRARESTCGRCEHCMVPGLEFYADDTVAWCTEYDEFIHSTDPVPEECVDDYSFAPKY